MRNPLWSYVVSGLIVYGGYAYLFNTWGPEKAPAPVQAAEPAKPPPAPTCRDDWHLCADNSEFANSRNKDYLDARVSCELAAKMLAKYGSPDFSWGPFQTFHPGDSIKMDGKMVLIDDNVTFKNGFNADVNSEVVCDYDFNAKEVKNVRVMER